LLLIWSKIPGVGKFAQAGLDAVTGFQNGMNKTLTGSAGQLDFAGTWNNAKAPNKSQVGVQTSVANQIKVEVNGVPGAQVKTSVASDKQDQISGGAAPSFSGYGTGGHYSP
jgi:hypothetical protein